MDAFRFRTDVRAAKIRAITTDTSGIVSIELVPERGLIGTSIVQESLLYAMREQPRVGGYYIQHDNGYASYMDAHKFEALYSPVSG